MSKINSNEFKQKLEELKKANIDEAVIEYDTIAYSELAELTKFFVNKVDVNWGWNFSPNVQSSGYINGKPFVIYPRSNSGDGALITDSKIAKFYRNNVGYTESIYDGDYAVYMAESFGFSGLPQKYLKISCCKEEDKVAYSESVKWDYGYAVSFGFNNDTEFARSVHDKLRGIGLAAEEPENVKKDGAFNCFNVSSGYAEYNINEEDSHKAARYYAKYSSASYYFEGNLPYVISFSTNLKNKKFKYFILLKDGRYVDAELFAEKGYEASIMTVEQINEMLKKENLSLTISEKLREFILTEGIPSRDVAQVVSGSRGRHQ